MEITPFSKTFEVKFKDAETRNQVAQLLCKEIKAQIGNNSEAYAQFKTCEYEYLGWSKYRRSGQKKSKPWAGACDFWASLIEWSTCAVAARVDSILFSVEPTMTALATDAENVDRAPAITDFVDMVMREIVELRKNIQLYIKQKIKQPLAILAYEWVYQPDTVREVNVGTVQPDFSITLETGENIKLDDLPAEVQEDIKLGNIAPGQTADWWVEKDKIVINQPRLRYISPLDYVWTNGTRKFNKPYTEGYRYWQTFNEIKLKSNNEEYDLTEDNWAKLNTTLTAKGSGTGVTEKALAERSHQFECFKVYTRLPFNKQDMVDFSDKEALEQEVIAEVVLNEEVMLKITKWFYLRNPDTQRVFIYGWYEEKDTMTGNPFVGRSLTEKLEEINLLINKEMQQIVDNADIAMMKMFTIKRQMNSEDFEEPEVFPGAFFEVDNAGDIQALTVGDVKQIGFQIMDSMMSFAARLSNISPLNTSDRMEGSKPLATEIVNILKEGEIGREGIIQSCFEDVRTIYKWTVDYYYQFMPDRLQRRIRKNETGLDFYPVPARDKFPEGTEGDEAYKAAMDKYEKEKFYSKDMLCGVGKWDFKWNGTQLSGDREWKINTADYLASVLMKFPMVASNPMAVWELLRDILMARGKRDWQKYLPAREKIEKEVQKKERMEQLMEQLPQMKQMLINQGIDPQIVDLAMQKIAATAGGAQAVPPQPPVPAGSNGKAKPAPGGMRR